MRRTAIVLAATTAALALALPATAQNTKYTFEDVSFPNGQTGVIEAAVKTLKNKSDSVTCSYFTDGYASSLGYTFTFVQPPPTRRMFSCSASTTSTSARPDVRRVRGYLLSTV